MRIFKPVGLEELRLMYEANMRSLAPGGPDHSAATFHLDNGEADAVARSRITKDDPFAGYVVQVDVDEEGAAVLSRFLTGEGTRRKAHLPAEEVPRLNDHLAGQMTVTSAHFGPEFRGYIPTMFNFAHRDALGQFVMLANLLDYSRMDFIGEIHANSAAVFLHLPYWSDCNLDRTDVPEPKRSSILASILDTWSKELPQLPAIALRDP